MVALNKIDRLADQDALLPQMAELRGAVPVRRDRAGQRGKGARLDRAAAGELRALLPERPPMFDADEITDRDERFLAAEFVREKIFRLLGEEVPYATTVGIDTFEEEGARAPHPRHRLRRARQPARRSCVGEGGAQMKAIATRARADMERLFGGPVFLEVWVRVKRGWADDDGLLTRFGY